MRNTLLVILISALLIPAYASLSKIGVVLLNEDANCPGEDILNVVRGEFDISGRFEVADITGTELLGVPSDSLIIVMRTLAADEQIDVFFAIEILPEQVEDRTYYRNDSLIVERNITIELLGRFYSSNGALFGSLSEARSEREVPPVPADRRHLTLDCAEDITERALFELFPIEVNFVAVGTSPVQIPAGTEQGLFKGMVMYVIATTSEMPDTEDDYEYLRSRALLQITSIGSNESEGHLLAGDLAEGGNVVAIEHGSPADISVSYLLMKPDVLLGDSVPADFELPEYLQKLRVSVSTAKWGLSFTGAFAFGGMEHISSLGIDFLVGSRIPLASPELALRLSCGGEMTFLLQETLNDSLTSTSAFAMTGLVDIDLEYMFSSNLGIFLGGEGMYGILGDSWGDVENTESGRIRAVGDDELYYTKYRYNGFSVHAGLIYMIF